MQPLRSVERSNFDKGRHNLTTLIQRSTYINESCYIIYIYIVADCHITYSNILPKAFLEMNIEANKNILRQLKDSIVCLILGLKCGMT